jgi:hypothetical protein
VLILAGTSRVDGETWILKTDLWGNPAFSQREFAVMTHVPWTAFPVEIAAHNPSLNLDGQRRSRDEG